MAKTSVTVWMKDNENCCPGCDVGSMMLFKAATDSVKVEEDGESPSFRMVYKPLAGAACRSGESKHLAIEGKSVLSCKQRSNPARLGAVVTIGGVDGIGGRTGTFLPPWGWTVKRGTRHRSAELLCPGCVAE